MYKTKQYFIVMLDWMSSWF